jgi:hypothetical protein
MKYKWILRLTLIFFFCFYFCINIFILRYNNRPPISPDELQVFFFSEKLKTNGTLIYKNPLNISNSDKIFGGRQFMQVGDNTTTSDFLGYTIILWLFRLLNSPLIFAASGPIIATASLVYFYKISKKLLNSKSSAYIGLVLLGFFPPFVYWSVSFYNNIAELMFLLGTLYYLFKALESRTLYYYILTTIFFCAAVWIRYVNILLIGLPLICYLIYQKKNVQFKNLLYVIMLSIIMLIPIPILNKMLYGSFKTIGESSSSLQLTYSYSAPGLPVPPIPLVPFRSFGILVHNIEQYLFLFFPFIAVSALIGGIYVFKNHFKNRKGIGLYLGLSILWIIYYIGGVYFGYGDTPLLSSSYTRYLLPVFTLMILLSSAFIESIKNIRIKLAVINVAILSFVYFLFINGSGLQALSSQIKNESLSQNKITKCVPPKGVVFTKAADKIILPIRDTALYPIITVRQGEEKGIESTLNLMQSVLKSNRQVYILNEDTYTLGLSLDSYVAKMPRYNLALLTCSSSPDLYRVVLNKEKSRNE